ncbi:head-tail connector protein [Kerstersia gyiorum]|uniref:head-tail connector protein n=1 Tax=Kerstersia gyiorum TaxID=206506 RepID=UPI00214F7781|nr:head-tail connector protein [Kerstersia gyiorum]MCR4158818.1 head-tail connector protein [Kerstersia gyiorum]
MLVSIDLAKGFLRVDDDAGEKDVIEELLLAAEQVVIDYLNRPVFESQEALDAAIQAGTAGDAPMVSNAAIRAAILKVCGEIYKNREDTAQSQSAVSLDFRRLVWAHRRVNGV